MMRAALLFMFIVSAFSASAFADTQDSYTLAGLFPTNGTLGEAGVQRQHAFIMAVNDINESEKYDFKLNYITVDSFGDPANLVEKTEKISDKIDVIVGPARSVASLQIAEHISTSLEIPQISYSSTSPLLSDTLKYPYFSRVVPSDAAQGKVFAEVLDLFGWKQLAIITNPDDPYSHGITQSIIQNSNLDFEVIPYDNPVISDDIRMVIMTLLAEDGKTALEKIGENNYVWLFSDGLVQDIFINDSGIDGIVLGIRPSTGDGYKNQEFFERWKNCHESGVTQCSTAKPNIYALYSYDAVHVTANTIQNILDQGNKVNAESFSENIKDIVQLGVTGPILFNDMGDRDGSYDIVLWRDGTFDQLGVSSPFGIIFRNN